MQCKEGSQSTSSASIPSKGTSIFYFLLAELIVKFCERYRECVFHSLHFYLRTWKLILLFVRTVKGEMDNYPLAFWSVFILKHMSEYGFSTIRIFPYMDQIFDVVRIQKTLVRENPHSSIIFHAVFIAETEAPI